MVGSGKNCLPQALIELQDLLSSDNAKLAFERLRDVA
jgi:hypothetical protein